MIDQRRTQQVLLNLLLNACKFQKEGKLVVTSRLVEESSQEDKSQMLEISVSDCGVGIDPNEVNQLF